MLGDSAIFLGVQINYGRLYYSYKPTPLSIPKNLRQLYVGLAKFCPI